MAFDASGTFTRLRGNTSWVGDATAGTKIKSDLHDNNDNDLAAGLSECLTKTGKSLPTVDIPWGGKKITNLANPTQPQDASTRYYVDTVPGWSTAKYIGGADLNGRLNFTSASGTNGITWTYADLSWVARHGKTAETINRLVLNSSVAPSTTTNAGDVFIIDDAGRVTNSGVLMNNITYDGSAWRIPTPGIGTQLTYSGGAVRFYSNDVATITNAYTAATLRQFFVALNSNGTALLQMNKSASGKAAYIQTTMGANARWIMYLGDATAESGTRKGSDFSLYSYDNDGANPVLGMKIERETSKVTFNGPMSFTSDVFTGGPSTAASFFAINRPVNTGATLVIGGVDPATGAYLQLYGETHTTNARDIILGAESTYRYFYDYSAGVHHWANNTPVDTMTLGATGDLTVSGHVITTVVRTPSTLVLACADGAAIYFRPSGHATISTQSYIDSNGNFVMQDGLHASTGGFYGGNGYQGKAGYQGSYDGIWHNLYYSGGFEYVYINATLMGSITWQSDYRIKRDIAPLPSMWDRVKAMRPIKYRQKKYLDLFEDDDTERWGMVAHELQQTLTPSVAIGNKDEDNVVQSINPLVLFAVLTRALQEAIERIEKLEGAR